MNYIPRKNIQASNHSQTWMLTLTAIFLFTAILVTGCDSKTTPVNPLRVDPDLKRGPYVQMGGTESILVVWQTLSETQGVVEFGLTETLGMRVVSSDFATTHSISLTGLQPGKFYNYRVLDGDRPLSKIVRFHTNDTSNDTSFSFLVVGDTGTPLVFFAADLINSSAASFGLHTGDVIYPRGEEELYDSRFFYPYAPFLATNVLYMSIGNHDIQTGNGAPYLNNFYLPTNNPQGTERYYSFDYGHAHFVALDTNQAHRPGSAQYTWLEEDLATTDKPWKFAFFHHPPYSAGFSDEASGRVELEQPLTRQHLVPLFEIFGVDVVFSGHSHSYERSFPILQNQIVDQDQEPDYFNPSGPIYIVTGGGGGFLTALDTSILNAREDVSHHIVEISLTDNELIGRAITPSGATIDQFRVVQ